MPPRPRLLLLDAVAVIAAYRCGGWVAVCDAYDVIVPATVIHAEAEFYLDREGNRVWIDLRQELAAGRIREYAATESEMAATVAILHPDLRSRIDPGEREALTYLRTQPVDDLVFVTADGLAIEAAVALDHGERVWPLATVLDRIGHRKPLEYEHTEEYVARKRRDGGQRIALGRALAPPQAPPSRKKKA